MRRRQRRGTTANVIAGGENDETGGEGSSPGTREGSHLGQVPRAPSQLPFRTTPAGTLAAHLARVAARNPIEAYRRAADVVADWIRKLPAKEAFLPSCTH